MNGWRCPHCGATGQLKILLSVWASLEQTLNEEVNSFQTDIDDGDHEWGNDSDMCCEACGWRGYVRDAEFTPGPSGCLTVTKGRKQ